MAAAITEIGTQGNGSSSATLVITLGGGASIGDTVVIAATGTGNAGVSSVVDSKGNTWTVLQNLNMLAGGAQRAYYSVLTAALVATDTITLTLTAGEFQAGAAYKITGLTSAPFDKIGWGRANDTAPTTAANSTGTLTQADEFILAFVSQAVDGTFTAGSGYSQTGLTGQVKSTGTVVTLDPEYKTVSSTAAVTATGTLGTSGNWAAQVFTFKIATGVAFDAASSSGYEPALSSYSWSHTCTGTNRGLIVGISIFAAGTVTAVTYAGQALTFLGAIPNGLYRQEFWGMAAPASGTNTIAVTLSTSLTSIGNAISYTGVNQTTPFVDLKPAVGTGNPAAVIVTPPTDNDWIVDGIATSDGSISVGAGQTSRANNSGALGSGAMSDKGPITPASAQTMQWTGIGALDTWAYLGVAVDPFVDATVFTPAQGIVELRGEIIASWAEALGDSGGGGLGLMFGPLARRRR